MMMRLPRQLMGGILVLLLAAAAVSVAAGMKNAVQYSQDFQYDAALALMMGIDPYEESLKADSRLQEGRLADFYDHFEQQGAPQKMEANQFPSLLMLLFPMALLPFPAAKYVWLALNLIFTGVIIIMLRRTWFSNLSRWEAACLSILMIAGTPWRNQLGVGQHTLFSLAFFLLAWDLSRGGHTAASGLCLAVSCFKYTLTAPLMLYFVYKRRFKELCIAVSVHGALTLISCAVYAKSPIYMIAAPLRVASALTGEGSIDIGAVSSGASWSVILTLMAMAVLFVLALVLPEGADNEYFSLLVLCSLVITYHRSYDFFVLVIPYIAMKEGFTSAEYLKRAASWLYAALLLMAFFGLRLFHESGTSLTVLAVMYYTLLLLSAICTVKLCRKGELRLKK